MTGIEAANTVIKDASTAYDKLLETDVLNRDHKWELKLQHLLGQLQAARAVLAYIQIGSTK
jgi:hypothetical protein